MMALQRALAQADWPSAERLLAPVARASKAHPSLVYNYAKVLLEQGRGTEALAAFRRVVEAAPDHADAWFEMGRAALLADDLQGAEDGFSQALASRPKDTDARRNLGRVLLRRGSFERAYQTWKSLEGDGEADIALYRAAAELQIDEARERRQALLVSHPDRAAVLRALVRVSKGAVPLVLPLRSGRRHGSP